MRALVRPEGDAPPASDPSDKPNVFVFGEHAAIEGPARVTNSEMDLKKLGVVAHR
jgi:hypothetical protein